MTTLVLTVIGDDRAGLVNALSEAVAAAGGNWEQSHLAELAGKFAGIILVTAPAERAADVAARLREVHGTMDVVVQEGEDAQTSGEGADQASAGREFVVELVGNDSPGIVREISGVFHRHDVSIGGMTSDTRDAPMSGGRIFEARITAIVPERVDTADLRADLEQLAGELLVDLELADA